MRTFLSGSLFQSNTHRQVIYTKTWYANAHWRLVANPWWEAVTIMIMSVYSSLHTFLVTNSEPQTEPHSATKTGSCQSSLCSWMLVCPTWTWKDARTAELQSVPSLLEFFWITKKWVFVRIYHLFQSLCTNIIIVYFGRLPRNSLFGKKIKMFQIKVIYNALKTRLMSGEPHPLICKSHLHLKRTDHEEG